MAKKKSTKKSGKKKAGRYHKARVQAKAKGVRPRSQVLPGLEQVRSAKLDNLCEGIAEVRTVMNNAKVEESGLIAAALQTMVQRSLQVYKHGGVELARVPGAEKLRVRLTKEQGDAGEDDLETPPAEGEDEGDEPEGEPEQDSELEADGGVH
jgi:hypothetical protein